MRNNTSVEWINMKLWPRRTGCSISVAVQPNVLDHSRCLFYPQTHIVVIVIFGSAPECDIDYSQHRGDTRRGLMFPKHTQARTG